MSTADEADLSMGFAPAEDDECMMDYEGEPPLDEVSTYWIFHLYAACGPRGRDPVVSLLFELVRGRNPDPHVDHVSQKSALCDQPRCTPCCNRDRSAKASHTLGFGKSKLLLLLQFLP